MKYAQNTPHPPTGDCFLGFIEFGGSVCDYPASDHGTTGGNIPPTKPPDLFRLGRGYPKGKGSALTAEGLGGPPNPCPSRGDRVRCHFSGGAVRTKAPVQPTVAAKRRPKRHTERSSVCVGPNRRPQALSPPTLGLAELPGGGPAESGPNSVRRPPTPVSGREAHPAVGRTAAPPPPPPPPQGPGPSTPRGTPRPPR